MHSSATTIQNPVNPKFWLAAFALLGALLFGTSGVEARELPDFRALISQHGPAVVSINTVAEQNAANGRAMPHNMPDFLRRFFDQLPQGPGGPGNPGFPGGPNGPPQQARGIGSGFFISADGYIVTNAHVVGQADEITITTSDRKEMKAELIGMDERTDLALLKVDGKNLPYLTFGDSEKLEVGEWVLAIGNPFGLEYTATQGIVSALGRSLPQENYTPFIQTDVAVNPGNSGGPLFALDGRVVGINSQIFSRTGGYMGLSFAIPSSIAIDVVAQLKDNGRVSRGWLGVTIQDLDQALAESFNLDGPQGALIADIVPGGPAEGAGLERGDVILKFNGTELSRSSDLPPLVGAVRPGKKAKLEILRNGKRKNMSVKIGEFAEDPATLANVPGSPKAKGGRLGLVIADLPRQPGDDSARDGVLVNQVKPDSAADKAGIRPGDIIVSFNQQSVDSAKKLIELSRQANAGSSVAVLVIRDDAPRFLALQVPDAEE